MTITASKYPLIKNDLYETETWVTEACIRVLKKLGLWKDGAIFWEPAAGNHAMVKPLYDSGAKIVITSDIEQYNKPHTAIYDFLKDEDAEFVPEGINVFTNPPYGNKNFKAAQFSRKALKRCDGLVAILCTAKFDFGSTRTDLFRDNPRFIAKIALLDRMSLIGNDEGGTEDHAWYIWAPTAYKVSNSGNFYERKFVD